MARTFEEIIVEMNVIFRKVLNNASIQLQRETTANDVKDWDSLNHIELVVAIEKHFKIKFNFADLQRFKNVGEMVDNIVLKLSQAKV